MRSHHRSPLFPYTTLFRSRSSNSAGWVPSAKSFLPPPSVTGKVLSHSSSTRSFLSKVWIKLPLPWTCRSRSEEHTSELQSQFHLVCRLLLEKKKLVAQNSL